MKDKLIFVVDDESAIADAVADYLQQNGLEVAIFSSPMLALAAAASCAPDLLLSDFRMYEMDGLTLAAKLKELHPRCKVLIMSGLAQEITPNPSLGEIEFMQKPLRMAILLAKVRAVLDGGNA